MAKQLAKAEVKNDTQKIAKIKEKQADLGGTGKKLMIGGLIVLVAGYAIWYLTTLYSIGYALWSLGGLAIAIGFILWLIDTMG